MRDIAEDARRWEQGQQRRKEIFAEVARLRTLNAELESARNDMVRANINITEENRRLKALNAELLAAAEACRSAIDHLMGDSDLPEDDSPEMKAMQMASAAIAKAREQT